MVPFAMTPEFAKDIADIVTGGDVAWYTAAGVVTCRNGTVVTVPLNSHLLVQSTGASLSFNLSLFRGCLFEGERYYFVFGADWHIFCLSPPHLGGVLPLVPDSALAVLGRRLGWPSGDRW